MLKAIHLFIHNIENVFRLPNFPNIVMPELYVKV